MSKLRLVHTADVHLGHSSKAFGTAAAAHRQRLREAFARCVACCTERDAQLFIIAGDLFDSPRPPEGAVQFVLAQLNALSAHSPPVLTVVAPGTHDAIQPGSIYERWQAQGLPPGVHLLTREQPTVNLAELGVAVSFAENVDDLHPDAAARWNIGVIHGSVQIPGLVDDDAVIFTQDQLAATGLDYVALGHWHSFHEYRCGTVTAAYPGSPEIIGLDQAERGQALVVDLGEDGGVTCEQVTTGTLRYREQEFDLADFRSGEELIQRILEAAGADIILDVRLTGITPPELVLDLDEVTERVAGQFFRVRVVDDSHPDWAEAEAEPPGLISGRFRQLMKERFEAAESDQQRQIIERARTLGLALLAGREVLG